MGLIHVLKMLITVARFSTRTGLQKTKMSTNWRKDEQPPERGLFRPGEGVGGFLLGQEAAWLTVKELGTKAV